MPGFTAVATGISMAAALGQGAGSAAQAAKFKKDQKRAERAAAAAMAQARQALTRNVQEEQRVRTMAFDTALRRQQSQTAQAIDALQASGTRGVLGGLQAVQAQATEADLGILAGMEAREDAREQAILTQEQANIQSGIELDKAEAQGAAAAAAAAESARAKAISSAVQGFGAAAVKATDFAALYDTTASERLGAEVFSMGDESMFATLLGDSYSEDMTDNQLKDALMGLPAGTLRSELRNRRRTNTLLNR